MKYMDIECFCANKQTKLLKLLCVMWNKWMQDAFIVDNLKCESISASKGKALVPWV